MAIALAIGTGANLLIAHGYPESTYWYPYSWYHDTNPGNSPHFNWPSVPRSVSDEIGDPIFWEYYNYIYRREYFGSWNKEIDNIGVNYFLNAELLGFPWTARSTKIVHYYTSHTSGTLWPQSGSIFETGRFHSAITYHPLGLILNPIIYALPLWLLLMGARWAYLTRRIRKRTHLGRCPRCAYDLDGLSVCPECGVSITPPAGSACS